MSLSAIQLEEYTIDEFDLSVNPAYIHDKLNADRFREDSIEDEIAFAIKLFNDDDNERAFGLKLRVEINYDRENWKEETSYCIKICIFGRFVFQEDERENRPSADQLLRFFLLSGINVLYGIARGQIAEATASQPYPRHILPMIDFTSFVNGVEVKDEFMQKFQLLAPED